MGKNGGFEETRGKFGCGKRMGLRGIPLSPRAIGIIEFRGNLKIIYGAQQLRGKIPRLSMAWASRVVTTFLPCLVHFGPFSLAARVLAPSVGPADWAAIPEAPNRTIQIRHTPLSSPANFILSLTTIPGIRAKIKKSRPHPVRCGRRRVEGVMPFRRWPSEQAATGDHQTPLSLHRSCWRRGSC